MPKKRHILFLFSALSLALVGVGQNLLPAEAGEPEVVKTPEELRADSLARVDSLQIALTDSLNNVATEAYKNLKVVQYDGITDSEFYPKVFDTYRLTMNAVGAPRTTEDDMVRHRSVLRDIAPALMRGAIFYSNNQDQPRFTEFARSYVDIRLDSLMSGINFGQESSVYPSLIYVAASTP